MQEAPGRKDGMSVSPGPQRLDYDLLGAIEVPAEALHGAQTQRALLSFPVHSRKRLGDYAVLVQGLLQTKQAAAKTNAACGHLAPEKAEAIVRAAHSVLAGAAPPQACCH